ncbi:MAG: YcxB family protein [Clostridiales bacterium]|nr:YcxB family protein [Clostridiales bacterium]
MELEYNVKIDAAALYDYMMRHTYYSASGLLGTAVGALLVCCFFMGRGVLYLILGCVLLLYLPASLFLKAKKQAAMTPAFQEPLHYKMTDAGVEVSQGESQAFTGWEEMYRAVSTSRSIILYTSRVNAFIFPKRDLGEKLSPLIGMISTHMPPARVKIRA